LNTKVSFSDFLEKNSCGDCSKRRSNCLISGRQAIGFGRESLVFARAGSALSQRVWPVGTAKTGRNV